jgi:hypothetical protein
MRGLPTHDISFPGDGWFVLGVLLLIGLIFTYVRKGRPVPAADCTPCKSRARTRRKPRTSNGIQPTTEPAVARKAAVRPAA